MTMAVMDNRTRQARLVARRWMLGGVLVVGAVHGLSACTGETPQAQAQWSPPAWFAEQARESEESRLGYQRCMDDKGWDRTMMAGGGSEEPFVFGKDEDRSELERFDADVEECRIELGYPAPHEPTADELGVQYDAEQDVAACLEHLGFDIPEPPSREAWVEALISGREDGASAEVWSPYGELARMVEDDPGNAELAGRIERAEVQCPQYSAL
ncbi:hypothetical protein [Cellulomonas gilvus]|uniref:Uncharacterized protein n=1 Tax=Cellulomonas gilvus (strain ATCC 13127 / NRRL B-14078) TaxID=593907 RepID=F8A5U6_CELGA|nr:hypothetical protein [Cellulomonas gilvus]AEI13386.1 hypothetical protein Celgi_2893 [Cellulomonas gilvus ATCC 13127]